MLAKNLPVLKKYFFSFHPSKFVEIVKSQTEDTESSHPCSDIVFEDKRYGHIVVFNKRLRTFCNHSYCVLEDYN